METIKIKQISAEDKFIYVLTERGSIIKFDQNEFEEHSERIIKKDIKTKEIIVEDALEPVTPEVFGV
ncbi:MAG: hypothetical protein HQ538_00305 [Parcubacteria group bacterium]|nr:hypothetical protein [Parcubacteria group bacterium]